MYTTTVGTSKQSFRLLYDMRSRWGCLYMLAVRLLRLFGPCFGRCPLGVPTIQEGGICLLVEASRGACCRAPESHRHSLKATNTKAIVYQPCSYCTPTLHLPDANPESSSCQGEPYHIPTKNLLYANHDPALCQPHTDRTSSLVWRLPGLGAFVRTRAILQAAAFCDEFN